MLGRPPESHHPSQVLLEGCKEIQDPPNGNPTTLRRRARPIGNTSLIGHTFALATHRLPPSREKSRDIIPDRSQVSSRKLASDDAPVSRVLRAAMSRPQAAGGGESDGLAVGLRRDIRGHEAVHDGESQATQRPSLELRKDPPVAALAAIPAQTTPSCLARIAARCSRRRPAVGPWWRFKVWWHLEQPPAHGKWRFQLHRMVFTHGGVEEGRGG